MASNQLNSVLQHLRQIVGAEDLVEATDGQLLQRFSSQRDEAAFAVLLERHGPMVLGVCRRSLTNSQDAEDAFQATFLVLVHKAASLRNRELVGNWLYGVACRIARRARTHAARRPQQTHEVPDMALAPTQPEAVDQELRPLLDEEVQRLPRRYRTPIVLCYLEGLTNEAVARQLRWPTGTVKTRLAKARDLLRERLARRGLALSAGGLIAALGADASAAMPAALAEATRKLAVAGQSGAVSPAVAGMFDSAVREMVVARLQTVVAGILALALLGGAGVLAYHSQGREEPALPVETRRVNLEDGGLAIQVSQRVAEWQPTKSERRFDEIGWTTDLKQACRMAQEHGRPIFLALTSGRIETGRASASATNMRASAFSHDQVIELLNSRFVPVYLAAKDYAADGAAPADEKAELLRIRQQGDEAQRADRSNHVWALGADGRVLASFEGCHAAMADRLIAFLEEQSTQQLPGKPVVAPVTQSRAPQHARDALVLHQTARYLERREDGFAPLPVKLGRSENYFSRGCPGENWLVFDRNQWAKVLPAAAPKVGDSWTVDPETAAVMFRSMYPPSEDNDLTRNRIDQGVLTGTVVAVQDGQARARLDGILRMKHRFDPERDDNRFVDATLLGFLDFDVNRTTVPTVQLTTTRATYGKNDFGVVVRSIR